MSRFDFSQCPKYCERARKLMFLQNPIIQKRLAGRNAGIKRPRDCA
jgi:hypothetical protein